MFGASAESGSLTSLRLGERCSAGCHASLYEMTVQAQTSMFADAPGYSRLVELEGDEVAAHLAYRFLRAAAGQQPATRMRALGALRARSILSPATGDSASLDRA